MEQATAAITVRKFSLETDTVTAQTVAIGTTHNTPQKQIRMSVTPYAMNAPSPVENMRRFIATEDLSLLDKPIVFEKHDSFKHLQCCFGSILCLSTFGLSGAFCPIGTFCPYTTFKHFGLRLDSDSVQMSSAVNDCCCHIAESRKTVPLEKVQDVELVENCLLTCFGGLKQVNVQTAGATTPGAEISAAFLQDPEQVRQAIQLAVKLHRQRASGMAGTSQQTSMLCPATVGSGQLMQRLQCLEQLVARGVLSREEAANLKVPVLASMQDPTQRLVEAKDLLDRGLVTHQEFHHLKASLINQMQYSSGV